MKILREILMIKVNKYLDLNDNTNTVTQNP